MKKGFFKLLFHRMGMVSIAIALQLVFVLVTVLWFSSIARWIQTVLTIIAWCIVLYILSDRCNPAYKMAWIIPILIFPVFGSFLYILFGGNRLSKRLKRKMADMDRTLKDNLPQSPSVMDALARERPEAALQAQYLSRVAHCPVYQNTVTEYFPSGEAAFVRMLEELRQAKESIYLEYFILAEGEMWDAILEILRQKAAEGVDVRLLYDDFGSLRRVPSNLYKTLTAQGIKTYCFNRFIPVLNSRLNNRDHRKFMLIDGKVGFTGGINLADEYINRLDRGMGYWKDCALMLRGDGVRSMTVMFLSMWNHVTNSGEIGRLSSQETEAQATGYVQPYADSPLDYETTSRTVYRNLIARATRRVWIMTPYLIIDDAMAEMLTGAAKSGVEVRIITPAIGDRSYVHEMTRANYPALIEGGVRIFEFTPGFIHSKVFLVDNEFAAVGTVNLDFRSLYLHFEDGVWMFRPNCFGQIEEDFQTAFPRCREITSRDCGQASLPRRFYRSILRLISPLM